MAKRGSSRVKMVVRVLAAVVLPGLLAAAGFDYRAKSAYAQTHQAIGDKLGGDGFPVSELSELVKGSPEVIGDPATDRTVKYRWKALREYELSLQVTGAGAKRHVIRVE